MKSFSLRFAVGFFLLNCLGVTLAKEVCYGKYGCFSDDPPFDDLLYKLPQSPEKVQTTYYVFTREDRIGEKTIDDSDVTKLGESSYDGSKKTVLITHGWTGKPLESVWVKDMKQAFLDKEDLNVIVVGWKEGASSLYYPQAVGNTRLVGAQVAALIKFLNEQTNNTPESFHVVGFSLGGQVSGYAGKSFYDLTNTKIGRITGLDPAGPWYDGTHIDVRLDASDGEFVDVIHTDSAPFIGTSDKSGHFDFWPNGGKDQRGCEIFKKKKDAAIKKKAAVKEKKGAIIEKKGAVIQKKGAVKQKKGVVDKLACDHYRAHQFFIESIKSEEAFISYRCTSWEDFRHGKCTECGDGCPQMGYNAVQSKELPNGDFYLYTNDKSPYNVPRYMSLTFETGTRYFADGYNPRVCIYGTKGNTGEIKLHGHLEDGETEKRVAPIKTDLGELQSIAVKNHGVPLDPWDLIKVTVQYFDGTQMYTACYGEKVYRTFVKKDLTIGNVSCGPKNRDHRKQLRITKPAQKYQMRLSKTQPRPNALKKTEKKDQMKSSKTKLRPIGSKRPGKKNQ